MREQPPVEPEAIPARLVTTAHRYAEWQPEPRLRQLDLLHQRPQVPGRHRPDARALRRRGGEPERPLRTPQIKGQHQRRTRCGTLRRTGRCGHLRLPPCCADRAHGGELNAAARTLLFSRSLGAYIASIVIPSTRREQGRSSFLASCRACPVQPRRGRCARCHYETGMR